MKQFWITLHLLFWSALVALCWAAYLWAETATLTWTANTEPDLAGYKVYQSTTPGVYGAPVNTIGKVVTYTRTIPTPLGADKRYYFTLTAFNTSGKESAKAAEVSKLVVGVPIIKTVTDTAGVRWDLAGPSSPYTVYRKGNALPSKQGLDLRLRNGIAEMLGTESTKDTWWVWNGTAWTISIVDPPPAVPKGLTVVKATETEVMVVASVVDCPRLLTSTIGSTAVTLRRTVRCVQE